MDIKEAIFEADMNAERVESAAQGLVSWLLSNLTESNYLARFLSNHDAASRR